VDRVSLFGIVSVGTHGGRNLAADFESEKQVKKQARIYIAGIKVNHLMNELHNDTGSRHVIRSRCSLVPFTSPTSAYTNVRHAHM
jgi:hypothetical protein